VVVFEVDGDGFGEGALVRAAVEPYRDLLLSPAQ
jgi:hypothetical protein